MLRKSKTLDGVLSQAMKVVEDLETLAEQYAAEAVNQYNIADEATMKADKAGDESERSSRIRDKLKDLLS